MPTFRISDVLTFFTAIGIALVFVAIWMIASERRRTVLKAEIRKLRAQCESYEREKFMLLEKISMLENTQSPSEDSHVRLEILEAENNKLKKELAEARGSLEEVYKALN